MRSLLITLFLLVAALAGAQAPTTSTVGALVNYGTTSYVSSTYTHSSVFPASASQTGSPAWTNLNNALDSDADYTSVSLSSLATSAVATFSSFPLSIPSGSIIDGVIVEVQGRTSGAGENLGSPITSQITVNSVAGTNGMSLWTDGGSMANHMAGSPTSPWGIALSNFTVSNTNAITYKLAMKNFSGNTMIVYVQYIRMTVYYHKIDATKRYSTLIDHNGSYCLVNNAGTTITQFDQDGGVSQHGNFTVQGDAEIDDGSFTATGAVHFPGTTSQYVRGDGSLATYTGGGGPFASLLNKNTFYNDQVVHGDVQLTSLTALHPVMTDAGSHLASASVTNLELSRLSGVTGDIQPQFDPLRTQTYNDAHYLGTTDSLTRASKLTVTVTSGNAIGATNNTNSAYTIDATNSNASGSAIRGTASNAGVGITGASTNGAAVSGTSSASSGVEGISTSGSGLNGVSSSGVGVRASSTRGDPLVVIGSSNKGARVDTNGNIRTTGTAVIGGTVGASNFSGSSSGTNTGDQTLPVGGNPTATISATANNGTSPNFMRADGSPALPATLPYGISGAHLSNLDASHITSGTLADARTSSNVAKYNANGTYSGDNTYQGAVVTPSYYHDGLDGDYTVLANEYMTNVEMDDTPAGTGLIATLPPSPSNGEQHIFFDSSAACTALNPLTIDGNGNSIVRPGATGSTYSIVIAGGSVSLVWVSMAHAWQVLAKN